MCFANRKWMLRLSWRGSGAMQVTRAARMSYMMGLTLVMSASAGAGNAARGASTPPDQPAVTSTVEGPARSPLLTVAESSLFRATSTHAQVVALCDALAASSPLVRRASLGVSGEGRELPLLIMSNPPLAGDDPAGALRARVAAEPGLLVVMAIGNIHAGEVDGKEALLMLAREMAMEPSPLLKRMVLLIAPIYNADGNERFAKDNRPGQDGPAEGQGQRANGAGLDLNRDFIKLDAPETRALVRAINSYDPHVFIDTHTTDGSFHRYIMTYAGPKAPAGSAPLIEYSRESFLPSVGVRFALSGAARGWDAFFYGNFEEEFSGTGHAGGERPHTRWESFPAEARYATTYVGLRSRLSILTESYSYAPYEDRVRAQVLFVQACLDELDGRREQVRTLLALCDQTTTQAGKQGGDPVTIRTQLAAGPEKIVIKGFVERPHKGRSIPTAETAEYLVTHFDRFEAKLSVPRPKGYVLTDRFPAAALEKLGLHGLRTRTLIKSEEMLVEKYTVTSAKAASRVFQGRVLVAVAAEIGAAGRELIPAGATVVETAQPLGNLAVYLLEPACEDGLAAWGFLDDALRPTIEADRAIYGAYPVMRLP